MSHGDWATERYGYTKNTLYPYLQSVFRLVSGWLSMKPGIPIGFWKKPRSNVLVWILITWSIRALRCLRISPLYLPSGDFKDCAEIKNRFTAVDIWEVLWEEHRGKHLESTQFYYCVTNNKCTLTFCKHILKHFLKLF